MSYYGASTAALAALGAGAALPDPPPAEMGAFAFLQLGDDVDIFLSGTTSATRVSESVSPPANADVLVAMFTRGSSAVTHDSVTAGFATVDGFAKIADATVEDPSGTFKRVSLWRATATAAPGSGTIVGTASGTTFQGGLVGGTVTAVGSLVTQFDEADVGGGSSISGTLTGAATGDVAFVVTIARGDRTSTIDFSDSLTQAGNSPILSGTSNFTVVAGAKTSPSATQTTTGLGTSQGRATVGALLRGAT